MEAIQPGLAVRTFDAAAASTGAGTPFAVPARAGALVWQTWFGTDPASIAVSLEYSLDSIHWDAIDSSIVVTGEVRTFAGLGGAPGFIRGNITAISGGAEVTMQLVWTVY
jgi:hypothetical protein